jgi:3'(2'), 5'-bisphosphate nucleotidase
MPPTLPPEIHPPGTRADLEFAISSARAAGERALAIRATGRWTGDTLADVGDQGADGFLQGLVRGRYPDDGILSEETADTRARLSKSRVWIIDPLDGTREYSQMRDDWAVHVALTIDGRCALGAVALPAKGPTLWGVCSPGLESAGLDGAAAGSENGLTRGDSASAKPPRIAVSRSHTPAWTQRLADVLGAELVHAGSVGNKVGLLLLGEADLYVHRKHLKEWDTCAPEVVARALGWTVCKLRGDEHVYNRPDPINGELVVCRPAWKERVIGALASAGALEG